MPIQRCVFHQVVWFVLAILCNLYSLWRISQGQSPLSSTDPAQGIALFLLFVPLLWFGYQGWLKTYLVVNTLFWLMIAYGGIGLHLVNAISSGGFSAYASVWGWLLAVGVNIYGVTFSVWGSVSAWCQFNGRTNCW